MEGVNVGKGMAILKIKYSLLVVYGILGFLGWYNYFYNVIAVGEMRDQLPLSIIAPHVTATVWYHSRGKLQELRSILLLDDLRDQEKIKVRITNMLKHRSSAYIRTFNSLRAPIPNLGNWYQNHFDFDQFLVQVFEVTFSDSLTVDEKIRDIADIMEQYQSAANQRLVDELRRH